MRPLDSSKLSSQISLEKLSKALPVYSSRQLKHTEFRITGRSGDTTKRSSLLLKESASQKFIGISTEKIEESNLLHQESLPNLQNLALDRISALEEKKNPYLKKNIVITRGPSLKTAHNFFIMPCLTDFLKEDNSSRAIRIRDISTTSKNSLVRDSSPTSPTRSEPSAADTLIKESRFAPNPLILEPLNPPVPTNKARQASESLLKLISTDNNHLMKYLPRPSKPQVPHSFTDVAPPEQENPEETKPKAKTVFKISKIRESKEAKPAIHQEFPIQSIKWEGKNFPELHKMLIFSKVLGSGAFSKVYQAIDVPTGHQVAVKVMDKSMITTRNWRRLVEKELEIMSIISHPNICHFYRMVESDTKVCLVMELGDNQTLSKVLSKCQDKKMDEKTAAIFLKELANTVAYLHKEGICHRDLKLSNVIVGHNQKIKLIDFGFAENNPGKLKESCGTLSYMAPELIKKQEYVGKKVDIWALGVILFRLVTGKFPFGKDEDMDIKTRICEGRPVYPHFVSAECRDLLDGCFRIDPRSRLSIDDVLDSEWLSKKLLE